MKTKTGGAFSGCAIEHWAWESERKWKGGCNANEAYVIYLNVLIENAPQGFYASRKPRKLMHPWQEMHPRQLMHPIGRTDGRAKSPNPNPKFYRSFPPNQRKIFEKKEIQDTFEFWKLEKSLRFFFLFIFGFFLSEFEKSIESWILSSMRNFFQTISHFPAGRTDGWIILSLFLSWENVSL